MLRRVVAVGVLSAGLVLAAAAPGVAHEAAPGGGSDFGQHVAGTAPEHAIAHGVDFGACVSAMARGLVCPHAER
jgi:hypothetical protein